MKITPEIVAKLIYGISQLRYFEREWEKDNHVEMRRVVDIWRNRIDQLLEDIGATEYVPLKELKNQIEFYDTRRSEESTSREGCNRNNTTNGISHNV